MRTMDSPFQIFIWILLHVQACMFFQAFEIPKKYRTTCAFIDTSAWYVRFIFDNFS